MGDLVRRAEEAGKRLATLAVDIQVRFPGIRFGSRGGRPRDTAATCGPGIGCRR